ncbi:hypothetical protein CHS0354_005817 [Potamilus streckersoni]|uniref:G-protein coupled receptors family 1 profile domain-containing protein n=1 Tax=Potamilus streckersoni TaxID=2493646 RepID=A0AAE0SUV4_9BIVA|nr:hypothetical protein CHS0354_005817 [Potamilus streckersoni]
MSDFGSRRACLIAIGFGLILSWPQVVIYGHSTAVSSGQLNITGVECFVDDSYKDTEYPLIYLGFTIFFAISTIITLIVLYSCIYYQILLHDKKQGDLLRTISRFNFFSCAETNNPTKVTEVTSLSEEEIECAPLNTSFEKENGKHKDVGNDNFERSCSSAKSNSQRALSRNSRKEESHIECSESVRNLSGSVAASKKKRKTTRKITMMMFSITTIFIISYTPSIIMLVADRLVESLWENTDATKSVIYDFLLRSYVINNVANPIIYGFLDNRFRSECIRLIKNFCFCHVRNVKNTF